MPVHIKVHAVPTQRWRLYFNSKQAAPMVCSLDNGDRATEFSVQQVQLHNIPEVWTTFTPGKNQPIFVVEFCGKLELELGTAHFYPIEMPINSPDFVKMAGSLSE